MPADFIFTEEMIQEACLQKERAKIKSGQVAYHRSLKKSSDFTRVAWNVWILLVPFLKKKLREKCPQKSLNESNGNPLFQLKHMDKVLELHILQPWAAKKLELPKIYLFKHQSPIEDYTDIVCKFN